MTSEPTPQTPPDARPIAHAAHLPELTAWPDGEPIRLVGDEAKHAASVKRVRPGEAVRLFDGQGAWVAAEVKSVEGTRRDPELVLEVCGAISHEDRPTLVVASAIPKGDRADDLVDQLSQLGAGGWTPMLCARSEQRDLRRADKLDRRAIEAAKQCGRAWTLEITEPVEARALFGPGSVLADASGSPWAGGPSPAALLVGPEGGWTDDELDRARGAGSTIARFGRYTMRIETAAVVAGGIVLSGHV